MMIKNNLIKYFKTEEEMIEFSGNFAKNLKQGEVILLNGPLGAGKTSFVKGIARGLNINKIITSPTFQIIKEYESKLCHIDAYRLQEEEVGIDFYKNSNYIICIEWSENLLDEMSPDYIVNIEYNSKGRKVQIQYYE